MFEPRRPVRTFSAAQKVSAATASEAATAAHPAAGTNNALGRSSGARTVEGGWPVEWHLQTRLHAGRQKVAGQVGLARSFIHGAIEGLAAVLSECSGASRANNCVHARKLDQLVKWP